MMLKTFSVVVVVLAMSVGLADARVLHRHAIPGCTPGNSAMATCACGRVNGRPIVVSPRAVVPPRPRLHCIRARIGPREPCPRPI